MAKREWTFGVHPEYFSSIRHIVSNNDRYDLAMAIRDCLEIAEDPRDGAELAQVTPEEIYSIKILDYIVSFQVKQDENRIRLMPSRRKSNDNE